MWLLPIFAQPAPAEPPEPPFPDIPDAAITPAYQPVGLGVFCHNLIVLADDETG